MNPARSQRGQAMVEALFAVIFFTAALFAAVQLAIIGMDDLAVNEAAFSVMGIAAVTPAARVREAVDAATAVRLLPHHGGDNVTGFRATVWDEKILGRDMPDHAGRQIKKYNVNIAYDVQLMFASLLRPFSGSIFLSGGDRVRTQTARARMVKSPDEEYYGRAWPGAASFDGRNGHE